MRRENQTGGSTVERMKAMLENNFKYHIPKDNQPQRYEDLRNKAKEFACLCVAYCPESRERSLALTKIEEAVMWVNASIARNE